MTAADAIATLDRAASLAQLVRNDHAVCLQAVELLRAEIAELERMRTAATTANDDGAHG